MVIVCLLILLISRNNWEEPVRASCQELILYENSERGQTDLSYVPDEDESMQQNLFILPYSCSRLVLSLIMQYSGSVHLLEKIYNSITDLLNSCFYLERDAF